MSQSFAIFRHNVRLLIGDPGPVVLFIITPLLMMAIMRPAVAFVLVGLGFPDANGAEQVVPGFAAMFTFFWMPWVGRVFIAEHGWGTWERLRTSQVTSLGILLGKIMPAMVIVTAQIILLFVIGALVFDLHSEGPVLALLLIPIPLMLAAMAITLALVGALTTLSAIDAAGNLATMVFASLGGSLVPVAALPDLAEKISPITPNHWVMEASTKVLLEGEGVGAVIVPALALLGFAAVFGTIAALTFRVADAKVAT